MLLVFQSLTNHHPSLGLDPRANAGAARVLTATRDPRVKPEGRPGMVWYIREDADMIVDVSLTTSGASQSNLPTILPSDLIRGPLREPPRLRSWAATLGASLRIMD